MAEGPDKSRQKLPAKRVQLPSLDLRGLSLSKTLGALSGGAKEKIPHAALIYGVASAALVAFALVHLLSGGPFTAFLLFVLAGVFFGFATHFLRFPGT